MTHTSPSGVNSVFDHFRYHPRTANANYATTSMYMYRYTNGICRRDEGNRHTCALVCLHDLQLSREIFPIFLTKGGLISIYHWLTYIENYKSLLIYSAK